MIKILLLLIVIALSFGSLQLKPLTKAHNNSLQAYAQEVLNNCSDATYRPSCYEKEVPKLMDKVSMEQAFEIASFIKKEDKEFGNVHVLAHNVSSLEVKRNPDRWREILRRCVNDIPLNVNGCIHGVILQRFGKESLSEYEIGQTKKDFKTICLEGANWNPTGLQLGSCYHAMGHLAMYLTGGVIEASLSLCEDLSSSPYICFNGVFMQLYQPLEPEDFVLIKGQEQTKDTASKFCKEFKGEQHESCWNEAWPLFFKQLNQDPKLVSNFCDYHESEHAKRGCFAELFNILADEMGRNHGKIKQYCLSLSGIFQKECFAQEASHLIKNKRVNNEDIENAVSLCQEAPAPDIQSECFDQLSFFAGYNFHRGSEQERAVCTSLPESWKTECPKKSPSIVRQRGIF